MGNEYRIGMVGLDTSHVTAFAQILMDKDNEFYIPGCKVVAGWPGGSDDFEMSYSRVDSFTSVLKNDYGVEILDTPEAVAEASDIVFLTSCDGRIHKDLFSKIAPYGKPVFIDKPLAVTTDDAQAIIDLAKEYNVPMTCSSSLRFSDDFAAALKDDANGKIVSMEIWGPIRLC